MLQSYLTSEPTITERLAMGNVSMPSATGKGAKTDEEFKKGAFLTAELVKGWK
jgi:hypothetical protein